MSTKKKPKPKAKLAASKQMPSKPMGMKPVGAKPAVAKPAAALVAGAPPVLPAPLQKLLDKPAEVHSSFISLLPEFTITSEQLAATFGLPDKLHAFKAADEWWADNVIRQLEGIDALRPDAREKLRAWYNEHARDYYKQKRKNAEKEARRKKRQDVIEAEADDKPIRH